MEDNKENAAAAEPVAAQPEATGTPPAKSAAETKLEGQLAAAKTKGEGYKKERDTYKQEVDRFTDALRTLNEQYDALKSQFDESQRQLVERITAPTEDPATTVAAETPSEEEYIKGLLKRNGLKVAYMLDSGPCFSEQHARQVAGEEFDSLTTISAE